MICSPQHRKSSGEKLCVLGKKDKFCIVRRRHDFTQKNLFSGAGAPEGGTLPPPNMQACQSEQIHLLQGNCEVCRAELLQDTQEACPDEASWQANKTSPNRACAGSDPEED